jgi:uncharacterized protein (DUF1778 family)
MAEASASQADTPEKAERISLSARDAEIFLAALEQPPEPSNRLKVAVAKYKADYSV